MPILAPFADIADLLLGDVPVQQVIKDGDVIWSREVVVVLSNSTDVTLKSLFDLADWDDTSLRKRVVVPGGVEIGATTSAFAIRATVPADGQPGSWSGELTLDIDGTVSGIGGAINSGNGGDAIDANLLGKIGQKLRVNIGLAGKSRGGGGGGGKAGNGGAGSVPYTYQEGPFYSQFAPAYFWDPTFGNHAWNNGPLPGGWNYYQGSFVENSSTGFPLYSIYRTQTRYNATAGGVAPNAGRGQGFDAAATAGGATVAGGTNAGASGKSGDGGAYGASGQAGANGVNGNAGSGTAGVAGGLAGAYLKGADNAILTNLGTVEGRLIA